MVRSDLEDDIKASLALDLCDCEPSILVVDDTEFNIYALKTILLAMYGIEADEAQNGQIALEMVKGRLKRSCQCQDRCYKLIFMDIQMPIMDGHQSTLAIIKEVKKANIILLKNNRSKQEPKINSSLIRNFEGKLPQVVRPPAFIENGSFKKPVKLKIVAVTAYSSEEIKKKCFECGMK